MKKHILTAAIGLFALHAHAQEKFKKTEEYQSVEKNTTKSKKHKKTDLVSVDYGPGVTYKHKMNLDKDKAIEFVNDILADSNQVSKLIKDGPNVINIYNGVILIDYNYASNLWTLDYKDRYKVVGDYTRPVRYFIKSQNAKKNNIWGAIAKL